MNPNDAMPLPFLIYINDLNDTVAFSKIHHFADDTNMLYNSKYLKDPTFFKSPPPPPQFSKILPFLEIQDVPTFHRPIRETKALNNS